MTFVGSQLPQVHTDVVYQNNYKHATLTYDKVLILNKRIVFKCLLERLAVFHYTR